MAKGEIHNKTNGWWVRLTFVHKGKSTDYANLIK